MVNRFPYSRRTSDPAGLLLGFHAGRTLFACTAAGTLLLFSGMMQADAQDALPAVELEKLSYPDKKSGDRARADGEYGTAASFYRQYRAKAEQNNDAEARKDAYVRELDALILANLADSAVKLLDEYRAAFPQLDPSLVTLWQAEIDLIRRSADEADKLLQKLLPYLEKDDPDLLAMQLRVFSCAAFAAELKGDYAAAAKYYGDIAGKAGLKTSLGRRALERQALSLAVLGKYDEAFDLLKKLSDADVDKRDVDAKSILRFYLTLSRDGFDSVTEDWNNIQSISAPRKDNFFFLAACRIGDEFSKRQDYRRAAEAFNLAYGFAAVREDAFDAMTRLIGAFQRLKDRKTAADLVMRMQTLFKDTKLSVDFKLQAASILFQADRPDDALDICLSSVSDTSLPAAEREAVYRKVLDMMLVEKAFPSARKFIDVFDTIPEKKPARAMDRAEVVWREKKPAEAAKLYRAVGESSREFRQEALLNAMRCCQDAGQYQDMLDIAALLRRDDPEHPAPDVLLLTAVAQFYLHDRAAAAQNYLDYEKAAPKTDANKNEREQALFLAGQLLSELGLPAKAVDVFRRLCLEYDRNDGKSRYWLIHCLYASGDEIGAERESWRFIEEKPDSQYAGAALLRLAEHYRGSGSVQHAESTLDQLLNQEKYPKIRDRAIYEKALIAFQRDDLAAAQEYLDRIDGSDPENAPIADIHYLRGDIARALNDFAKARTEYEAAAKAAAGTRLEQAALGSAADCIYALASAPAPKTVAAQPETSAADKEKPKDKETKEPEEKQKPATPADNYRKAFEAYQALLKIENLLPEYRAMAIYKSGQSLWKAGDEKAAFDLFKQMVYLVPARDAAVRPVEAYWCFRAVEALESLAHKDPSVSNVESAVSALVWLGQTGTTEQESVRQRIRALRKKQYQPPLPASSNTTPSPESSKS